MTSKICLEEGFRSFRCEGGGDARYLRALHDAVADWQTVPEVREFRQAMSHIPAAPV